jgi:hypothetical protein
VADVWREGGREKGEGGEGGREGEFDFSQRRGANVPGGERGREGRREGGKEGGRKGGKAGVVPAKEVGVSDSLSFVEGGGLVRATQAVSSAR